MVAAKLLESRDRDRDTEPKPLSRREIAGDWSGSASTSELGFR